MKIRLRLSNVLCFLCLYSISYQAPGLIINGCVIEPFTVCAGAQLSGVALTGANLSGAVLTGANLEFAALEGADLSNANLSGAYLNNAKLFGADLSNAIVFQTRLVAANLVNTNLSGANLEFADMEGASLFNADLGGANLGGANLTNTALAGATYDGKTIFTTGFDPVTEELILLDKVDDSIEGGVLALPGEQLVDPGEQNLAGLDAAEPGYRVKLSSVESITTRQQRNQLEASQMSWKIIVAIAVVVLLIAVGAAYWLRSTFSLEKLGKHH